MVRTDPGDHFDGVGWGRLTFHAGDRQEVEQEYMMWREDVLATAQVDSGTGDNDTQVLWPRPAGR